MKALLDTNIIIHRENTQATNYSIGLLFYWLDKMHYEKCIHPFSIQELRKLNNPNMQKLYDAKLSSYVALRTVAPQSEQFKSGLQSSPQSENDAIDNQLLCEVFSGRVDILITEDRRMRNKALSLGISDRVYSINSFVSKMTSENPNLLNYRMLSVTKELFGNIDVTNPFFDSFRASYNGFNRWFFSKSEEEAYICKNDNDEILGLLYLKTEYPNENYSDISPTFLPKKRLKIGTFKVETSGFRLGERFIKIIFDNALERQVDEIYVTLFDNQCELAALKDLFIRWGFQQFGKKACNGKEELVLIKSLNTYDNSKTSKENFPNLQYSHQKFILPIYARYHTTLLPDSKLNTENEVDFLGRSPHRYALQKVYISFSSERNIHSGDLVLFYRPGENPGRKKYESVLTTLGMVEEIRSEFPNKEEFLLCCQNRSVFTQTELDDFWNRHRYDILVLKFVFVKSLNKRLNLEYLWDTEVMLPPNGPRPFTRITDAQFDSILSDSDTAIRFCDK